MSSVKNDGNGFSIWNLFCCCCKEKDPKEEPLLRGHDPSIQKEQYGGVDQQRHGRPRTPDSAFGKQGYQGRVAPLSPTHMSQSSSRGSHSDEEEIEQPGTPDSAFGAQHHQGDVTGTSPVRV